MKEATHRSFLVVDVEDSGDLNNVQLGVMRSTLHRILDSAIAHLETAVAKEDRGDGCMLVLALPVLDVLDKIVEKLLDGVRAHNYTVDPSAWVRLRIAVHEGYVHEDENGWLGDALTSTFRMNDARLVKDTLKRAARAHGIVVISDAVYQGVVRHSYRDAVTPAGFESAVISTKEGDVRIWARVPGYAIPPLRDAAAPLPSTTGRDRPPQVDDHDTHTANNLVFGNVTARNIIGRDNHGGIA